MRLLRPLVAIAFLMPLGVSAQSLDLTLNHTNPDDLSPAAREAYESAVYSLDRADHIAALYHMADAAELAPDCNEIQILFIDLAGQHARLRNLEFEDLEEMIGQVVLAYERVIQNPQLPVWAMDLLQREYEQALYFLDNAEAVYAERLEQGREIQQYIMDRRNQLDNAHAIQVARLRAERAQQVRDPGAPNPIFQEAAAARRGANRNRGVQSVRQGVGPSSGHGVERVG